VAEVRKVRDPLGQGEEAQVARLRRPQADEVPLAVYEDRERRAVDEPAGEVEREGAEIGAEGQLRAPKADLW
jgi:hypothetical protein